MKLRVACIVIACCCLPVSARAQDRPDAPATDAPAADTPAADAPAAEASASASSSASAPAPAPVASPAPAGAARIQGVVRGSDASDPVPGATILVAGTTHGAISEADGTYAIDGLPPATYTLRISATGYRDAVVQAKADPQRAAVVDVNLGPMNPSEVIVVTGSRSPEKVLDSPATVEYVTENDIKRAGGVNYMSALSNVKGVDFAEAGIGDQRISMRGFTSQFNSRLLSMIDGRVAQLPGSGLPQGNALPAIALDMKSIEVVVGPASALYGPNAHTGVVNVITKTPWDASGASIALRGGTQDLIDAAARIAGVVGHFGWKLNGQYLQAKDFEPDTQRPEHKYNTTFDERDLVDGYGVKAAKLDGTLYYRLPDDWVVKGTYGFSQGDGIAVTNNGRNRILGSQVQSQNIQLSGKHVYAQLTRTASDAGTTYPIDVLARTLAAMGPTLPSEEVIEATRQAIKFTDNSQLYDGEIQVRDTFAGVESTFGLQARMYRPDSGGTYLADAAGENIDANELGGYGQLSYKLLDERLRLVGALRVDGHSDYATQVSPKAAVVFKLSDNHNLRAGYNRAFKSPTILENNLLVQGVFRGNKGGYEVRDGNGDVVDQIAALSPERVNSFELGYKGVIADRLFVDAVVYDSFYRNFISPLTASANPAMGTFAYLPDGTLVADGTPAAGTLYTYRNFGAAQVRGVDAGLNWKPIDGVELMSSVSAIDLVDFTQANPNVKDLLLNVPRLKLKSSVTVSGLGLPSYFVRVAGRFQSAYRFESGYWSSARFFADNDGKVPSRFVADLVVGYAFPKQHITVTGTVANVLDDRKVDLLGSPVPGRLAFLQLEYTFDGLRY